MAFNFREKFERFAISRIARGSVKRTRRNEVKHIACNAESAMRRKNWNEAVLHWKEYLAVCEREGISSISVNIYIQLSAALRNLRRFDEAEQIICQMLTYSSDKHALIKLQRSYAEIAMAREDWGLAIERWHELEKNCTPYDYIRLSRAYTALDRIDEAEICLQKGIEHHPEHIGLSASLAELAMCRRDWLSATRLYERVFDSPTYKIPLHTYVQASLAYRHLHQFGRSEIILHNCMHHYANETNLWIGDGSEGALGKDRPVDVNDVLISIRRVATHMLHTKHIREIHTQTLNGGLGNNGCFTHTVHYGNGNNLNEVKLLEKWPINTRVRNQTLQESRFYVHAYPFLGTEQRRFIPRPWYIAEFGPNAMIVTDFVKGERADGNKPTLPILQCMVDGIAAISSVNTIGMQIGEVGPIRDGDLIEFRRSVPISEMSENEFSKFRNTIERLNKLIYVEKHLTLCRNDLNWSNVLFSTDVDGVFRATFIDWGRCAKNVLGADLLYFVPGGLRMYSPELFETVVNIYAESMANIGSTVEREQISIGAYYAAMQWMIERSARSKEMRDIKFAMELCNRLQSECL